MTSPKLLPHDRFIRTVFAHPEAAQEFFSKNLPASLRSVVNLDTLKAQKESYVTDDLRMQSADLLFSVDIDAQPGYIYTLVEHMSSPDPLMCWRLLTYMMRIQEDHLTRARQKDKSLKTTPRNMQRTIPRTTIPLVLPFVLYTGKKPWRSSMHFFDLFGPLKDMATMLFNGTFPLVDVSALPDTALETASLLNTSLLAMKYIRQLRNNPQLLSRIFEKTALLEKQGETDYAKNIVTYMAVASDFNDKQLWNELLTAAFKGDFAMNLLQQFEKDGLEKGLAKGRMEGRMEGRVEGRMEGIEKVALNLLEEGMSVALIMKATGLSASHIQQLKTCH